MGEIRIADMIADKKDHVCRSKEQICWIGEL